MDKITQALTRIFERQRIVFWYDQKQELFSDFDTLNLDGVEKIKIANNEFAIKHRILREQPKQKFLLYHEGEQPADPDNWLLDVQLAHGEFRTDQAALWLSEIELGPEFTDIVQSHTEFFQAVKRREGLKGLLKPDDTQSRIRMKMLAICAGSEPRVDEILESLLAELADGRDEKSKLIGRSGLDEFLFVQMERHFAYRSTSPGIKDFAIELFKSCYRMGLEEDAGLTPDALVFLKRWKDSIRHHETFEKLSDEFAGLLGIEQDLDAREYRDLIELDYFQLIDRKILRGLVDDVEKKTISADACRLFIRQRRQSHWYSKFQDIYEAIDHAAQFIHALDKATLTMESMPDGISHYTRFWYKLDQLYRKFIFHVRKSGQSTIMQNLTERIENLYSNNYLLKVNGNWQSHLDNTDTWNASPVVSQKKFFSKWVQPFLRKNKKVFVVISDAMRYEIGEELLGRIRQEDRFEATIEAALAMLPSYTQLCMAALLPNKEISIAEDATATAIVDGHSSAGTENRKKILDQAVPQRGTAIRADYLLGMNNDECRAMIRDHDVVYVYHNRIDATGDKMETEGKVFEAVENTLQELVKIVKKLTGANANNLLVTADHGFIYQHRPIDESDYSASEPAGDQIFKRDRRFVLGKGLIGHSTRKTFRAVDVGLVGDMEIQIPKSINRLRLRGSGSRFVHGGASLQEVVVPVIQINKKRESDITAVEVDILPSTTKIITSGQIAVTFYQAQPVSDKVQKRTLRAGIFSIDGELISDEHKLDFDFTSENPREREIIVRFVLSRKADNANNQDAILKLRERTPGTSHFADYKSISYTLRRSFTSDFDFD